MWTKICFKYISIIYFFPPSKGSKYQKEVLENIHVMYPVLDSLSED